MKKLEMQVEEYIAYCRDVKNLSYFSVANRRTLLLRFARNVEAKSVSALTNEMIEQWVSSQSQNGKTRNTYATEVKTFIKFWLLKGEKIRHVQLEHFTHAKETPRRKVFYTGEQINQVLERCDDLEWLLIKMSFDCGLRLRELTALRLENIDGRRVHFTGKGRKLREAYIGEDTKARLDKWIADNEIADRLWIKIYVNGKRQALCPETVSRKMKDAFHNNGFPDFHPHALRHSFATEICKNGASLEVAKEMLGHSDIRTTAIYVHSLEGRLEDLFMQYKFAN